MDIFDQYIKQVTALLSDYTIQGLSAEGPTWPISPKNPFLMERDTALELGSYPKDSINLILSSSNFDWSKPATLSLIGNPDLIKETDKPISYGKIVLLKTGSVDPENTYNYLKSTEIADIRLRFSDVMLRMSSQKFFSNLRIGKKAMKNGFSIEKMGRTMLQHFLEIPEVEAVHIILLLGDSPLYKQLLPIAEQAKELTITLNTMLDSMEFNCKSCTLSSVCAEVEGLRKLHAAARTQTQ